MPLTQRLRNLTAARPARLLPLALLGLLGGCNMVVLNPSGHIAVQQGQLIVISTVLMLLIIVPVIALTLLFAWRYRQSNTDAPYEPDWDHSTSLELVIWGAPLLIIIALGLITWITTHTLDPYRPLFNIDANRPVPPQTRPLTVQVVAMDWKWLFIYPEQGVASVNELVAPVDQPINFKITSTTVMNSFFVPALAGQIYAMPGMQTQLNAVINKPGEYQGFSANYSGAGFSGMHFKFKGVDNAGFDAWVKQVKGASEKLDRQVYLKLEQPSERVPVRYFASVAPDLYEAVLNRCVDGQKMCMNQMMAIDAQGGMGGSFRVAEKTFWESTPDRPRKRYVEALACTADNPSGVAATATN